MGSGWATSFFERFACDRDPRLLAPCHSQSPVSRKTPATEPGTELIGSCGWQAISRPHLGDRVQGDPQAELEAQARLLLCWWVDYTSLALSLRWEQPPPPQAAK